MQCQRQARSIQLLHPTTTMRRTVLLACLAAVATPTLGAIPGHEITSLPGWEGELVKKIVRALLQRCHWDRLE